jgi:integration host factor subunit beta
MFFGMNLNRKETMATISKKDIANRIAETHNIRLATTKKIVQAFLDEMITELAKGNRLEFRDFGIFDTRDREAREAQNPKTLEKVHAPAKRFIKFKMGRVMKQKLNATPQS